MNDFMEIWIAKDYDGDIYAYNNEPIWEEENSAWSYEHIYDSKMSHRLNRINDEYNPFPFLKIKEPIKIKVNKYFFENVIGWTLEV